MTNNTEVCNNCGRQLINLQDKFCTSCGADLTNVKQVRLDETVSDDATVPGAEYTGRSNGLKFQLTTAFRNFLPAGQKVSEEERKEVLKYFEDHSAVIVLQTREADRYNNTHLEHKNHLNQDESVHALLEASKRLLLCADECILRHRNLSPVPKQALQSHNAWGDTFRLYRQWVRATHEAFLAVLEEKAPNSETVQNLFSEQNKYQIRADRIFLRLGRSFGLVASDLRMIADQIGESTENDLWEPDTQVEDIGSEVMDKDVP